jgi:hypothetical protein
VNDADLSCEKNNNRWRDVLVGHQTRKSLVSPTDMEIVGQAAIAMFRG